MHGSTKFSIFDLQKWLFIDTNVPSSLCSVMRYDVHGSSHYEPVLRVM